MFCSHFAWKRSCLTLALGTTVLVLVVVCATQPVLADTEKVLYSFGSYTGDALWPYAGLVMDTEGNLYGTTYGGGTYGLGTVFKLTPDGSETLLYSFGSQSGDGEYPEAGLIIDKKGNLYGTTYRGGTNSDGTVFKVTSAGVETVLYSFGGSAGDGEWPVGGLIMDKKGNLYGTTSYAGAYGGGTVFKVTPAGIETVLYNFGSIPDGNTPWAGLIMDKAGNLYGTTFYGGVYNMGTVFKLTPGAVETVLYSFDGWSGDGQYPLSGLVMDTKSNLYGTTEQGGAYGDGTVFKLASAGTESILYSFGSHPGDGANAYPYAGPIRDKKGNLYGTTIFGGADNDGLVYEISPPAKKGGAWTETILYTFTGEPGDGERPFGGLVMDANDNLYGTTYYGGATNNGTVFELTP